MDRPVKRPVSLRGIVLSQWTLGLVMAAVLFLGAASVALRFRASTRSPHAGQLADTLTTSGSPVIADVVVDDDPWFSSPEVYVTLVAGATDAEARDVWCSWILPSGIRWQVVMVTREIGSGEWLPPGDCADPDDIPAYRRGPST